MKCKECGGTVIGGKCKGCGYCEKKAETPAIIDTPATKTPEEIAREKAEWEKKFVENAKEAGAALMPEKKK